ncbi:P22 phage major capsid protein family protein [Streptomyces sp. NPDC002644]
MPNTFPHTEVVAKAAPELLKAELVLGRLVFRDAEAEFSGGVGDSVRIRVPKLIEAAAFAGSTSAVTTNLNERSVTITLSQHGMNGVELTAKDMTLDVTDFLRQVIAPQVAGVAKFAEMAIAAAMQPVINAGTLEINPNDPRKAITRAGAILDAREVSAKDRILVVDPEGKEVILNDPALSSVADAGSADELRNAHIGRLHGFDVYVSPYIKGAIAMTREAFAAAFRAPAKPQSMNGASYEDENGQGYAMTWFMGFDLETRQERSITEIFAGAALLDDKRAVGLKLGARPATPTVATASISAGGAVTGKATPGSHVLFKENGAVVAGGLVEEDGDYSITAPALWMAGTVHLIDAVSVAGGYESEPTHAVVSVA